MSLVPGTNRGQEQGQQARLAVGPSGPPTASLAMQAVSAEVSPGGSSQPGPRHERPTQTRHAVLCPRLQPANAFEVLRPTPPLLRPTAAQRQGARLLGQTMAGCTQAGPRPRRLVLGLQNIPCRHRRSHRTEGQGRNGPAPESACALQVLPLQTDSTRQGQGMRQLKLFERLTPIDTPESARRALLGWVERTRAPSDLQRSRSVHRIPQKSVRPQFRKGVSRVAR